MRSLHVIGSRRFGGAERFYTRLTTALTRHGEDVLCVLPPNSELRSALSGGPAQHPVAMRSVFDPIARVRIGRCVRTFNPHIVQTYMGRATRLTHISARRDRPVHVARLGGYYDVSGYRHAHAWVVNAHGIRDHLIDAGFDPDRVFYIGNFVEPVHPLGQRARDALRDELGLGPDAWVLVCLGRLHRNKGFDVMLEALARLPRTVNARPLCLVMVGDGPERDALRARARDQGLDPLLRWTGWRDDPDRYLQLADLFVCPSRHEPLGNVVLEAWSAGAPVLASDTGGLAELVSHDVDGALVPPDDPEALAHAIQDLLDDTSGKRAAYARAGALTVVREHGEAGVVQAYQSMYSALAATL